MVELSCGFAGSYPSQLDAAPPAISSIGLDRYIETQYYELRLGSSQQLDYLAAISRRAASGLHRQIARHGSSQRDDSSRWSSLLGLIESFADARSWVGLTIPTLWLEFDDINSGIVRAPSVCACLVAGYDPRRPIPVRDFEIELRQVHAVTESLRMPYDRKREEGLNTCFRSAYDVRWIHLSIMLGRTPVATKLYGRIDRNQLLAFLHDIGWSGDFDAIRYALKELYSCDLVGEESFIDLNLENFQQSGKSTLGLSVAAQHQIGSGAHDLRRSAVLERWQQCGLCKPEQALFAQSWVSGGQHETLEQRSRRFLDLKLVWEAQSGFAPKAYLGRFCD
jgi:hypothetical protein